MRHNGCSGPLRLERECRHVADRHPQPARDRIVDQGGLAAAAAAPPAGPPCGAPPTAPRPRAAAPSRRAPPPPPPPWESAPPSRPADGRRPRPRRPTPWRPPWRAIAAASSSPDITHGRLGFGLGQRLHRHLGQDGERAPGARHQLAEIVAGDVLHHPARPTGRSRRARTPPTKPSRWSRAAPAVIRRGPDRLAAMRAPDAAAPCCAAQELPAVHRLESEPLPLGGRPAPRSRRAACRPWRSAPAPRARRA